MVPLTGYYKATMRALSWFGVSESFGGLGFRAVCRAYPTCSQIGDPSKGPFKGYFDKGSI